jgi:hypothetical protein
MKLKILFTSANPSMDLKLDEEYRTIEEAIAQSNNRDSIELIPKIALRAKDLMDTLHQEQPDIVHFSGHGAGNNGYLVFNPNNQPNIISDPDILEKLTSEQQEENELKKYSVVSTEILEDIFEMYGGNTKLVLFNSCNSKTQAKAINKYVDFTIGMSDIIGDDCAVTFSKEFYKTICSNRTIEQAFKQSHIVIKMEHPEFSHVPKLFVKEGADKKSVLVKDVKQQEPKEGETTRGTTISINGDVNGVANVSGGTVNQTINQKTVNAETNIESLENKDGGVINFK